MIQKDNQFEGLIINYHLEGNKKEKFSEGFKNIERIHPIDIISKEMIKREKRKIMNKNGF